MPDRGDYLPRKEAELVDWLDNFSAKVQGNDAKWQIPKTETDKIAALTADFKQKHAKCSSPDRSKILVEEKDIAKAAVIAAVREMVRFRFANPAVSDAERLSAGLHSRDKSRTPVGIPASRCLIAELKPLGGFRVDLRLQDEAAPDSRAIPYGCNGGLLSYAFGPEKIADYSLLKESKLMTGNPFVLQLPPAAEGTFLSCAARWQNNKGELGPWSEIMHIAVS